MEEDLENFSDSEINKNGPKKKKVKTRRMSPRTVYSVIMSEAHSKKGNRLKGDVMNKTRSRSTTSDESNLCRYSHLENVFRKGNDISHQMSNQIKYNQRHECVNNEDIVVEGKDATKCSAQERNPKFTAIQNCGNIYNLINESAEDVIDNEQVAKKYKSSQQSADKDSPSLSKQECANQNSHLTDACFIPEFSSNPGDIHTNSQANVSIDKNINNESNSKCHNDWNVLNTDVIEPGNSLSEIDNISHSQKTVELDVYTNTKVGESSGIQTENDCFKKDDNIQVNNISNISTGSGTSKNCNTKLTGKNMIASCDNDPFEAAVSNSQFLKAEKNISFTRNDQLNLPGCSNTSSDINLNVEIKNDTLLQQKWQQAITLRKLINLVDKTNKDILKAIAAIRHK